MATTLRTPSPGKTLSKAPWAATSVAPLSTGSLTFTTKRGAKPDGKTIAKARQNSLAAAATPINAVPVRDRVTRHYSSTGALAWQEEVLAAAGQIGELRYIANTTANAASRAWVYPADAKKTADAAEAVHSDNGDEASAALGAPPGVVDPEIVRRIALLLVLIGEAYIVELPRGRGRPAVIPGAPVYEGPETHILAPMDVKFQGTGPGATVKLGGFGEYALSRVKLTRVHRPDVRCADDPDSPAKSALPVLRELIALSMHVSASIDSRLAGAGVFVYPIEAQLMRPTQPGAAPHTSDQEFPDALTEAMIAPISDRDNASAVMPILLGVPGDTPKEALRHISFAHPLDANVSPLRSENIRRLALGMDAPPEVILGAQGLSGFGAWSVEGEFVRLQIAPLLRLIAAALSVAYGTDYTFDTSPLTVRPNKAVEAQALFDRGVIGDATLRHAAGFSEDDAPVKGYETDPAMDMALMLARNSPSLLQTPGLPAVVDQCRIVLGMQPQYQGYYPNAPDAPMAGSSDKNSEPSGSNDRENPREAAPAEAPESSRPRSDRGPQSDSDGKPRQIPGTD